MAQLHINEVVRLLRDCHGVNPVGDQEVLVRGGAIGTVIEELDTNTVLVEFIEDGNVTAWAPAAVQLLERA